MSYFLIWSRLSVSAGDVPQLAALGVLGMSMGEEKICLRIQILRDLGKNTVSLF